MAIHYLMNHNKVAVLNWVHQTNFSFEFVCVSQFMPLISQYYQYLKLKSKYSATVQAFLSSSLASIKQNPQDLLQKTEEIVNVTQSLINIKSPILKLIKNKAEYDFVSEICTWVLSDSQAIYNSFKNGVYALWQAFQVLEPYSANRAREIFIRYNNLISQLKDFSEKCPEEYPGQIPKYSTLNDKTMEEVNSLIIGKENLIVSTDLLNFEHIEKDGSPKKHAKTFRSLEIPENSIQSSYPSNLSHSTNRYMVPGYPVYNMYPMSMMYTNQMYYQYPKKPL
jgi:ANTH domain